ncbi:MAG: sigma-70 family RNA polymerase sigma factor [Acidimicrobiales bacterium]
MRDSEWLVDRFERRRSHLRAIAYRMLGSLSEADDALQEVWLRLSRSDRSNVDNLDAWLTTVVGRVCLNRLRSRERRREDLVGVHIPDPIITNEHETDPAQEVAMANSIGLALLVVIETLTPAERVAFVLHDMFGVSFQEIATMLGRSTAAARQLASRARRRVHGEAKVPDADLRSQWEVVDVFFAAARGGDFERLVTLLDPDVVLRVDAGLSAMTREVRGAETVAGQALMWSHADLTVQRALINSAAGVISIRDGSPFAVIGLTITGGRIAELDILTDPQRLATLDLTAFKN